jgi:hypothetical protein
MQASGAGAVSVGFLFTMVFSVRGESMKVYWSNRVKLLATAVILSVTTSSVFAIPDYPQRTSSAFQGGATQFEGDSVPTTQGSGGTGDPSGWSSDGNILTIVNTNSVSETWLTIPGFTSDPNVGYTLEMRFRVASVGTSYLGEFNPQGSTPGSLFAFAMNGSGVYDTLRGPNVQLYSGDLTADFHTLRVAVAGNADAENGPGDHAYMYMDGELIGTGWTSPNPYALSYGGPTRMLFGDTGGGINSGTLLVDYIRVDTTGPFAPVPEPATVAMFCGCFVLVGWRRRISRHSESALPGGTILAATALSTLIIASQARSFPNYPQRDSTGFQGGVTQFEGTSVPSTMGSGGTGDPSMWSSDGDVLTIVNQSFPSETWFLMDNFSPNASNGYTMEVRFKITDPGTRYLAEFNSQAASPGSLFAAAIGADGIYDTLRNPINPVLYEFDFMDDQFHTMRIAFAGDADTENGPGDHAYLYVDGNPIGEGFTSPPAYSPAYSGPVRFLFADTGGGMIDGTILIDYLRLDTTGAYAPVSAAPPGDFNLDGSVDAADYVTWLKNSGTPEEYTEWTNNFGAGGSGGSASGVDGSTSVPEPLASSLLLVGIVFRICHSRVQIRR